MKKSITILFLFFTFFNVTAQTNLVPNGDFELYSNLPTYFCQTNLAVGWNNVNNDYTCSKASPDYYNTLSFNELGAINPISGNGQIGLFTYIDSNTTWREYISSQLLTKLIPNNLYKISFYLTNGIDTMYTKGNNNFGIHFSTNPLYQAICEPISVIPQIEIDTVIYFWNHWHYFSFNYIPTDSFNYITIGNFRDNANTIASTFGKNAAYFFIDKIVIIPIFNIIGDSIICKGDTAILTASVGNNMKWATVQQPNIILSTDTILQVYPSVTTTYLAFSSIDTAYFTVNVVNPPTLNFGSDITLCNGNAIVLNATQTSATYQWQDGSTNANFLVTQTGTYWVTAKVNEHCQASDTIDITYRNCDFPEVFIPNAITPDGDGQNDAFSIYTSVEFSSFKVKIFNRREQQIFESDDAHFRWDATFKGSPVSFGVYMYYIEATDKLSNKKLSFKGSVTVLY